MVNELVRRLEVLDEKLDKKEILEVIEKYIQQLKNSEFNWKQIRDIVISALKGFNRKENIRKEKKRKRYRTGKESLETRVEKKLTEKLNWFKVKKIKVNEKEKGKCENKEDRNSKKTKWHHYNSKKEKIIALENE